MQELYDIKERYMEELKKYGKREPSPSSLETVSKLTASIKNLCKIIDYCEQNEGGEYSSRSYSMTGHEPGKGMDVYGGSYEGSYARGRRNAPRDSMGRYSGEGYSREGYSRHGDAAQMLREVMADAPDEQTRRQLEQIMRKMEQR